jgi:hypothetical protein
MSGRPENNNRRPEEAFGDKVAKVDLAIEKS